MPETSSPRSGSYPNCGDTLWFAIDEDARCSSSDDKEHLTREAIQMAFIWSRNGTADNEIGCSLKGSQLGSKRHRLRGQERRCVLTRPRPVPASPWHLLHLEPTAPVDGRHRSKLMLPAPRAVFRHALPVVVEGVIGPLALFYVVLILAGFRSALIAALCWSYVAVTRRLLKRERISMLLFLGTILITARTVIAFVTGSAFVYFAQPTAGTVLISLVLFGSALLGRPFTQRFAHDFCPMDPAIMQRPLVRRFFIRISVLWAIVLMLNAGFVFWLLVSSSLRSFVLERSAVTYGLTAVAIFFSVTRFVATMRRDDITVEWATS